jgi:5-methylcytosine-specific restriction endonuclease McrA
MTTRTTYNSQNAKDEVWSKSTIIEGKNPKLYRKDPYSKTIYYHSYGKDTKMGWNIDHIKPKQKGGSDDIINLQALQSHINKSKGDNLVKKSRHSKNNK